MQNGFHFLSSLLEFRRAKAEVWDWSWISTTALVANCSTFWNGAVLRCFWNVRNMLINISSLKSCKSFETGTFGHTRTHWIRPMGGNGRRFVSMAHEDVPKPAKTYSIWFGWMNIHLASFSIYFGNLEHIMNRYGMYTMYACTCTSGHIMFLYASIQFYSAFAATCCHLKLLPRRDGVYGVVFMQLRLTVLWVWDLRGPQRQDMETNCHLVRYSKITWLNSNL